MWVGQDGKRGDPRQVDAMIQARGDGLDQKGHRGRSEGGLDFTCILIVQTGCLDKLDVVIWENQG